MNFIIKKIIKSKWFRTKILEKSAKYFDDNPEEFDALVDILVIFYTGTRSMVQEISKHLKYEYVKIKYQEITDSTPFYTDSFLVKTYIDGYEYYKLIYYFDEGLYILPLIISKEQFLSNSGLSLHNLLFGGMINEKSVLWQNDRLSDDSVSKIWKIHFLYDETVQKLEFNVLGSM